MINIIITTMYLNECKKISRQSKLHLAEPKKDFAKKTVLGKL